MTTISVCTLTCNRRIFIPTLIKCFNSQTYPKHLIEWVILDDGIKPVGDLFKNVPNAKYYRINEKLKLGKKRNLAHSYCKNEIIVYMDDDDYYPPDRIKEAVLMLESNPKILIAGSSKMYMYYTHIDKIYELGPYGKNHSTAGTFAFRRELLKKTQYEDEAERAEEKYFLKNYTFPMVQLNPLKTILVISHEKNTFDKKQMIGNGKRFKMKKTNFKLKKFIRDSKIRKFYQVTIKKFHEKLKKKELTLNNQQTDQPPTKQLTIPPPTEPTNPLPSIEQPKTTTENIINNIIKENII